MKLVERYNLQLEDDASKTIAFETPDRRQRNLHETTHTPN